MRPPEGYKEHDLLIPVPPQTLHRSVTRYPLVFPSLPKLRVVPADSLRPGQRGDRPLAMAPSSLPCIRLASGCICSAQKQTRRRAWHGPGDFNTAQASRPPTMGAFWSFQHESCSVPSGRSCLIRHPSSDENRRHRRRIIKYKISWGSHNVSRNRT